METDKIPRFLPLLALLSHDTLYSNETVYFWGAYTLCLHQFACPTSKMGSSVSEALISSPVRILSADTV